MARNVILLRHNGAELVPNDQESLDRYRKLKRGEVYRCEFKRARNPEFNAKMFVVLNAMYDNQREGREIHPFDNYRHEILRHLGYIDSYVVPKTGEVVVRVKSMAFSEMDEEEFTTLYNDVLSLAARIYGDDFVREFDSI